MIIPENPVNEDFRVEALKSLDVLETASQKEFDQITAIAAQLCNTSSSLISLVDNDREWFKSSYGFPKDFKEGPRDISFCGHAILDPEEPMIVNDARKDNRFCNNPYTLQGTVVFYASVCLIDSNGYPLGTLCVFDSKPKTLTDVQLKALKTLADQIILLFELNKKNTDLKKTEAKLIQQNECLKKYTKVISQDLKMPLSNVITTTDVLKLKLANTLDEETSQYFDYIKKSSFSINTYINDVVSYYDNNSLHKNKSEYFNLRKLLKDIVKSFNLEADSTIDYPDYNGDINCNKPALRQILNNLIDNSIKYNDKQHTNITIDFSQDSIHFFFRITDNGMGIPEDKIPHIFKLFTIASEFDRSGNKGNGIGLSTAQKLVENLGGRIHVESIIGIKTIVDFSIKKQIF